MIRQLVAFRFRQTTLCFLACLFFLIGVGCAHSGKLINAAAPLLLIVPAVFIARKRTIWAVVLMVALGLSVGWWRGSVYMIKLHAYDKYYGQKLTISAVATGDAAYGKYKQLTLDARQVTILETGEHLKGKISLSGFGENAIFAGDTVIVTGKLKPSLGSYQGRMSYAQLHVSAHHNTTVNELRRRFTSSVQSALPEPLASFGMGLLIGQRNNLPDAVSQSLLMVGLTHIIAVSGYNLTILLQASNKLFGKQSKRMATGLSLGLIATFLLFSGNSASIVRAAIVSVLSIFASYYGRQFRPLVLITLAAAITAYANPFYVWSDSGWYLSFLAFFGVMILAPMIKSRWKPKWQEALIPSIALESICAEAMALPFVLHAFGQMSFIGLPANILIAALVPLAMLLTMIAGIAGLVIPLFAGWFVWPAKWVLTYMLDMAHLLSSIPHVFEEHIVLQTYQMILLYLLLIGVAIMLRHRTKQSKAATITDKQFVKSKESKDERSFEMVNHQT